MIEVTDPAKHGSPALSRPIVPAFGAYGELLRVTCERSDGTLIVRPEGEIDMSTAPRLAEALADATEAPGASVVIVDLAGVSYLDSTAIHLFLQSDRRLRDDGRRLALRSPTPEALRVLDLIGITSMVETADLPTPH